MKPFVSVVIPCRDEDAFIGRCLASVLASEYPRERLEVIVADGMSQDGTRERVEHCMRLDPRVRRMDNPERTTPHALNRAIAAARGDLILRLDAHATIAPDYIARAVKHLRSSGADCVGGSMRTLAASPGLLASAIRTALSHPFGVGNSHFRTVRQPGPPRFVDAVFGACWSKDAFARLGGFDERLKRSQDIEFSSRLRRAGGRILLAPDMKIDYYAPATLRSFLLQSWTNGIWAILPFACGPFAWTQGMPVRWRHLAPLALLAGLGASALASAWLGAWTWAAAACYAAANLAASAAVAWREKSPSLAVVMPWVFAGLHLAYGAGSMWGCGLLAFRANSPFAGKR